MPKLFDGEVLAVLGEHNANPYSEEGNAELLTRVPEAMRLMHYTRQSVPAQYLPSFGYYHSRTGNIRLDAVPEPMQRELMFVIWRIVELGGRVPCGPFALLTKELAATAARLRRTGQPWQSLTDRTSAQWRTELATTWSRRTAQLPKPRTLQTMASNVDRACKLLWFAYDQSPWWRREVWDPKLDERIPQRAHEPRGSHSVHWHRIETPWLRIGAMWSLKCQLETERLTWSSVLTHYHAMTVFDRFVVRHGLTSPLLVEDAEQLRPLMLTFLEEVRQSRATSGLRRGEKITQGLVTHIASTVRGLYAFLHDNREDAAGYTGDARWADLGPEYLRFWRPNDLPSRRRRHTFDERHLFSDRVLARISEHAHLIAEPRENGGLGDSQTLRLLLLMIATGRRVNELCMLDARPLIPVHSATGDGTGIAKLRYQQTKIEGGPDTIFVDNEVVQIIAEQQRWAAEHLRRNGCTDSPRYLFLRLQNNNHGQRHYSAERFRNQLVKLARLADLRDEDGQLLQLSATHRFRHTKATSLLNAGVPLHVVQRYLGHTSPEMTMHYAQTLDATAKSEFLRYSKITASGHAALAAEDLYDVMALDTRTDRVLPNGWCTLPPARSCDKGNACLTCDLFVTDRRFLDIHKTERVALDHLIDQRQAAHEQRTGTPMSEGHVWLTIRRREQAALDSIVERLEADESAAVGAGVAARIEQDILPGAGQR